jgi:hypothetical protein
MGFNLDYEIGFLMRAPFFSWIGVIKTTMLIGIEV